MYQLTDNSADHVLFQLLSNPNVDGCLNCIVPCIKYHARHAICCPSDHVHHYATMMLTTRQKVSPGIPSLAEHTILKTQRSFDEHLLIVGSLGSVQAPTTECC